LQTAGNSTGAREGMHSTRRSPHLQDFNFYGAGQNTRGLAQAVTETLESTHN